MVTAETVTHVQWVAVVDYYFCFEQRPLLFFGMWAMHEEVTNPDY